MNICSCYEIDSIIREMEAVLQIDGKDYEERFVDVVIQTVRARISRQYQIDLSGGLKIDSAEHMLAAYSSAVAVYMENVVMVHAKFCGICQIARYTTQTAVSLDNINFLGFTEETVRTVLQALQRRATAPLAEDALTKIKENLATINTCREKRLILLMVVAYDIGFYELSASLAEYLYLSCV